MSSLIRLASTGAPHVSIHPVSSRTKHPPRSRMKEKFMRRILGARDVEAAVRGGSVFAAGGGGWADHGRMLGRAAVAAGKPELVSMTEVPDEAWIATAAAIGAPAGTTTWEMRGEDYVRAVELLEEA